MYDMSHLRKLAQLKHLAPEANAGFQALDNVAFQDGAIPRKYKELMAIACAQLTQCPYCLEIHAKLARKHGATNEEIAEAAMVAVAMAAGAAYTHAAHVLESLDTEK